jgi:hypothetical protein
VQETAFEEFCRSGTLVSDTKDDPGRAIHLIPFFPGEATVAWPIGLSALVLILIWFRDASTQLDWRKFALLAVALFTVTFAANYVRILASTYEDGRRAYSYASDIDKRSAFYQLFALFGLQCVILAGIWTFWLTHPALSEAGTTNDVLEVQDTIELSVEFGIWQRVSVLLACGFLPGAFCFWRIVYRMHDARYVFPAALYQCVYAMTWYIVSKPLASRWTQWHELRLTAIAELGSEMLSTGDDKKLKVLIEALEKLQPIPRNTAVVATLATAAALLAPFYEVFAR